MSCNLNILWGLENTSQAKQNRRVRPTLPDLPSAAINPPTAPPAAPGQSRSSHARPPPASASTGCPVPAAHPGPQDRTGHLCTQTARCGTGEMPSPQNTAGIRAGCKESLVSSSLLDSPARRRIHRLLDHPGTAGPTRRPHEPPRLRRNVPPVYTDLALSKLRALLSWSSDCDPFCSLLGSSPSSAR